MHRTTPLLAVLLLGCSPSGTDGPNPDRVARAVTSAEGDIGVVVGGHNAFSWDVYDALRSDAGDDNVFFSPFSITAALGMTLAGADGDTRAEMLEVLHVSGEEGAWHAALGSLIRDLNGDLGRGYTLHVANRLFGQTDYPWEPDFLAVCEADYGAPLEEWDFTADPEGGRERVNAWVEEQTQERIVDLLPAGSVDDGTRLVLANAIYFLADWASAFDPDDTRDQAFRRLDGSTVDVEMMHMDLEQVEAHGIEAGWNADASVLRMPYEDDEVSMIVVVPHDVDGLPALEAGLDAAAWDAWTAGLSPADVPIGLPRLELRYEKDLVGVLAALGMPSAFDDTVADFGRMADTPERLFVTGVFHQAFVLVDEHGTEAAAATGVVVGTESAPSPIIADRPFLFAIQDDLTGAILFLGRVTDPS